MPHILTNKQLALHLDLPGEIYRAARFDWTGLITQVSWNNIQLTGLERDDAAQEDAFGKGLYNEFGIDTALGFEEAETGGWFHKIGVGLLRKTDPQYLFSHRYEIRPATFEVVPGAAKLVIRCLSEEHNGYAYVLTKEIELQDSHFTISYRLENRGEKVIHTSEYVHNFMAINQEAIGPNYALKFPFPINPEQLGETVNPDRAVELSQNEIRLKHAPTEPFFFSKLGGPAPVEAAWKLLNHSTQIGIRETGSFPCKQVNLWGCGHVISPELFVELRVMPGESTIWSRTYHVFRVESQNQ